MSGEKTQHEHTSQCINDKLNIKSKPIEKGFSKEKKTYLTDKVEHLNSNEC